jgi:hypothetical protein
MTNIPSQIIALRLHSVLCGKGGEVCIGVLKAVAAGSYSRWLPQGFIPVFFLSCIPLTVSR